MMIEHRTDGSDTLQASREYFLRQLGNEIDRLKKKLDESSVTTTSNPDKE